MKFEQKIIMLKFKLCDLKLFITGCICLKQDLSFDLNIKKMMGWHDGTKPCSGNQNSCMDSECDWGPLSFYFYQLKTHSCWQNLAGRCPKF